MVTRSGEEIVRRVLEIISESESVDVAMAEFEQLMHPEIEFVNPEDAIERGTRTGEAGIRTVLESLISGAGGGATFEPEQVRERGGLS